MQCLLKVVLLLSVLLAVLSHLSQAERHKRALRNPRLTAAILEELLGNLDEIDAVEKRRVDAGYGSRYGVASSVGSKLMALKQAADWNSPGRKRRDANEH